MDDPSKLKFRLNREKITVDQLVGMDDRNMRDIRHILAVCLVDRNGAFIPIKKGLEIIGKLNLAQFQEVNAAFQEQVRDEAVNPTTDESSLPLSGTAETDPPG